mmetsp:Transcript_19156/g.47835  ORF Transcript_19156/g.47835 Transcript_19156/m.47835 type:complete len:440 (-) Transcript_19156:631-1950(-)
MYLDEMSDMDPALLGAASAADEEALSVDSSMRWEFNGTGSVTADMLKGGVSLPATSANVNILVDTKSSFGGGDPFLLEYVTVAVLSSSPEEDSIDSSSSAGILPALSVTGSAVFSYPCLAGGVVEANAQLAVISETLNIDNLNVNVTFLCSPVDGQPVLVVSGAVPLLVIKGVTAYDVALKVTARFSRLKNKYDFCGMFEGSVSIGDGGASNSGFVRFMFETDPLSVEIAVGLHLEWEEQLILDLFASYKSDCNLVTGDVVEGTLTWYTGGDGSAPFVGAISGRVHCDGHPAAMALAVADTGVAKPVPVGFDAYNTAVRLGELAHGADFTEKGTAAEVAWQLSNTAPEYPKYEFDPSIAAGSGVLFPGIAFESLQMKIVSMGAYSVAFSEQSWGQQGGVDGWGRGGSVAVAAREVRRVPRGGCREHHQQESPFQGLHSC